MIPTEIATCSCRAACCFAALAVIAVASPTTAAAPVGGNLASFEAGGLVRMSVDGVEQPYRLYGIAGLEAGQPFEPEARTFVQEWAMDHPLQVEVVAEDESGLPVAWVRRGGGESLNAALLAGGFAWWDRANAPSERDFRRLAAGALAARAGLWAGPAPLAPWDYRTRLNLPPIRYKSPEPAATPAAPVPTLAAKGDAAPQRPAGLPVIPEEFSALAGIHLPRIARDGAGNPLGLTATDIAAIPGAAALGFQNGDIVQSVNGIAITNELQILVLLGQLQDAKQLELTVLRGGKPVQVTVPLQ